MKLFLLLFHSWNLAPEQCLGSWEHWKWVFSNGRGPQAENHCTIVCCFTPWDHLCHLPREKPKVPEKQSHNGRESQTELRAVTELPSPLEAKGECDYHPSEHRPPPCLSDVMAVIYSESRD